MTTARSQLAGLAHLRAIAEEQAAAADTVLLPSVPKVIGTACGDQLAQLEAEQRAWNSQAPNPRRTMFARKSGWVSRMLGAAVVALGIVSAAAFGSSASAATPPHVASTTITNRPDNGHGSPATWAYDDFTRTLTV